MDYKLAFSLCESKSNCEKSNGKVQRSMSRQIFLSRMFSVREILKWKYNYFETNPHEHRLFQLCLRNFNASRQSFKFKKLWRLKMDQLFYEETLNASKFLLNRELKKLTKSQETNQETSTTISDPSRLLVNYDREVDNMIRRVKDEYNSYLLFPKLLPNYQEEVKKFLIQKSVEIENNYGNIRSDIDKRFQFYWESRIPVLCDMRVAEEKRTIRNYWKKLLPAYVDSGEDTALNYREELQVLLPSEGADDEDQKDDNLFSDKD